MKYIIGGGLSGLITAYYNPEYTVIAPDMGGFIDSKFGRALVVLHATDGMRRLFDELDVKSFEKRIKLGYYDVNDRHVKQSFETDGAERTFARNYIGHKLPHRFQPGKDLELSAPGDSWEALFVDSSIVSALANNVNRRMFGHVTKIEDGRIYVQPEADEAEWYSYDELISTVPAPLFEKIADVSFDLDYHQTTYAELPRERIPDRYLTEPWNLLYTVDPTVEYHRVARNMLSSRYYVECLGDVDVAGAIDQRANRYGVIDDTEISPPYENMTFLGRYAEWEHERRIDHVLEIAKEGFE